MNGKLTKRDVLTVVLTTVCIMSAVVGTAFLLTTVLSSLLIHYPGQLGVSHRDISHDYWRLLWYLLNPFTDHLGVVYLKVSAHGSAHYQQVKSLFTIVEVVVICSVVASLVEMMRIKKSAKQLLNLLSALRITFIVIVVNLLFFLIDFNAHFINLHRWLFNNHWWVFNVMTDQTILLMPISFFVRCCLLWLVLSVVIWGVLDVILRRQMLAAYFGLNKAH